jgi:type VI secretion system VgrG family protein
MLRQNIIRVFIYMNKPTSHTYFGFQSQALPEKHLKVVRFEGNEQISRLYCYRIELISKDPAIDLNEVLGQRAFLIIRINGEEKRLHGAVSVFRQGGELPGGLYQYYAELVPRLWFMSLSRQNQVYQNISVPDIIDGELSSAIRKSSAALTEVMLTSEDYQIHLIGNYSEREYIVQFKESDLDFISRLMEHEGIFYFFEQDDDREKLIITDTNGSLENISSQEIISYVSPTGMQSEVNQASIQAFSVSQTHIPHKLLVKDFNYQSPSLSMIAEHSVYEGGTGQVANYGDHFKTPEEGESLAQIRSEEWNAQKDKYCGESDHSAMSSGHAFVLSGHFRADLNQNYVITTVKHFGNQAAGEGNTGGQWEGGYQYHNEFESIPIDIQFRPARVTPKPRLYGIMNGIIDGELDSEYAQVDDQGRYKVLLPFDLSDSMAGTASKYIRMSQPSGGGSQGMHFPLRKGAEIIWTCIDGDMDRPIILGAVPNPLNPSPVTGENNQRNVIATGGGNEINIDDAEGNQRIKMTTPFMGTSFQIGSPNSSEAGAILSTGGNVSSVAGAGLSTISSVSTTWTAFQSIKSAGSITNIAEPGASKKTAIAALAATTILAVSGEVLSGVQSVYKTLQDSNDRDALEAINNWYESRDHVDGMKQAYELKKSACYSNPSAPPEELVGNGSEIGDTNFVTNFETAINTCIGHQSGAYSKFHKARGKEYDAQRKGLNSTQEKERSEADRSGVEIDAALDACEATINVAQQAVYDTSSQTNASTIESDDQKSLKEAIQAYYDAVKNEHDIHKKALTASKTADDLNHELSSQGTEGKAIAGAENSLAVANAAKTLVSVAMSIYNLWKGKKESLTQKLQWVKGKTITYETAPRHYKTTATNSPFSEDYKIDSLIAPTTEHIIGSTQNAVLYGEEKAYVWGETVVIQGQTKQFVEDIKEPNVIAGRSKGKVAILGEESVIVSAKEVVEIKGKEKTLISGKEIDIMADEAIRLTTPATDGKNIELRAKGDEGCIKIIADKKDIELEATEGKVDMKSKLKYTIISTEDNVFIESKKQHIDLLSLEGSVGAFAREIVLYADDKAEITQGSAKISLEGGNITIEGADIKFNATGSLDLSATGAVSISGASIELK